MRSIWSSSPTFFTHNFVGQSQPAVDLSPQAVQSTAHTGSTRGRIVTTTNEHARDNGLSIGWLVGFAVDQRESLAYFRRHTGPPQT